MSADAVNVPFDEYAWLVVSSTELDPIVSPLVTSWTLPSPKLKVIFEIVPSLSVPFASNLYVMPVESDASWVTVKFVQTGG